MGKKIIITEEQEKIIMANMLYENSLYSVEPDKVLLIKKYLDKNFKRGTINDVDSNGNPSIMPIVAMIGTNGDVIKNMSMEQLYDLLIDQFKDIYSNKIKQSKFIAQIIKDWYSKKITNDGLLSVNIY